MWLFILRDRNHKQKVFFEKYTSHLFVLTPGVGTLVFVYWCVVAQVNQPIAYLHTSKLYQQALVNRYQKTEFDRADTHHCFFFFSLKVTQCTKSKSGNSKILGSIKNFLSLLQVWIRKQCTYLYWASALLLVGQPRGKLMQISNEKKPAADPCPATTAAFKGCWHSEEQQSSQGAWKFLDNAGKHVVKTKTHHPYKVRTLSQNAMEFKNL